MVGDGDGQSCSFFGISGGSSSSSNTSEAAVAVREIKSMLVTWAEKVERFCSMD